VYAQGFCELHSSSGGSFNGSFAFDYKLDCRPSGCPSDVRSAFKTGYVVLGVTTDDICSSFEVTTSSTVAVALDSYSDATFDDTRRRSVVGADDRVWFRVVRQSRRRCSACRGRVSLSLFLSFSLSLSLSLSRVLAPLDAFTLVCRMPIVAEPVVDHCRPRCGVPSRRVGPGADRQHVPRAQW
jgi:hypothetical protein